MREQLEGDEVTGRGRPRLGTVLLYAGLAVAILAVLAPKDLFWDLAGGVLALAGAGHLLAPRQGWARDGYWFRTVVLGHDVSRTTVTSKREGRFIGLFLLGFGLWLAYGYTPIQ